MMAFGMPFFAAGVFLVLAGTGILPIDKSHLGGPQWILAFVGLAFGLPGWFYVSAGAKALLRGGRLDTPSQPAVGMVVAVVLSCMAIVCLGGALFVKAEAFFGGIRLFGVRLGFRGNSASLSRVIFGLAGFLIAGIAFLSFRRCARSPATETEPRSHCPTTARSGRGATMIEDAATPLNRVLGTRNLARLSLLE